MSASERLDQKKKFDVLALGECLIDFTPSGRNDLGMILFACNPGGAPANVLAMNAKLGGKTAFIGKVGNDEFGKFLRDTMVNAGIDVSGLCMTPDYKTTLAFVQLNDKGDRSFTFYRKPGADVMLEFSEVKQELLESCHIFHFGSVSLTDEPCRSTTLKCAEIAKEKGAIISYDPNYRPPLWKSENEAIRIMKAALPLADIIKVSEEEMHLLTGEKDLEDGARKLAGHGAVLVLVTMGPKGAFYMAEDGSGYLATYDVNTVDTTGAGDAFLGALHYRIAGMSREELKSLPDKRWREIIGFSNAAGSLTTTARGAIPAMPDREQIEKCIKERKLLK